MDKEFPPYETSRKQCYVVKYLGVDRVPKIVNKAVQVQEAEKRDGMPQEVPSERSPRSR
jgi:hypothetical protein